MRPRTSTWIAWSLGTLWVVLLAPTLLLFTSNLFNPEVEVYGLWVQGTFVGVIFPAIGLFLVSRRPEHPIGWLFCAAGLVVGLDHFCGEYAIYALLAQPGSLPAGQAAAWVSSWLWVPFTVLMLFFLLLFPDGRLPSGRWRSFAWLVGIAAIVGVAVQALLPVPTCEVCPIENPLGIEGLESVAELVDALVEAFLVGVLGSLALASLFLRFRRASACASAVLVAWSTNRSNGWFSSFRCSSLELPSRTSCTARRKHGGPGRSDRASWRSVLWVSRSPWA